MATKRKRKTIKTKENLFDMLAINTCRLDDGKVVGHLPREISHATKYLLDSGANITSILSSTHYRKSPLFQGGLEIPCTVKVKLRGNIKGDLLIAKYKEIIEQLYLEPKEEVIVGCFLKKSNVEAENLVNLPPPKRKKKADPKKANKEKNVESKDIRQFFNKSKEQNKRPQDKKNIENNIITIELKFFLRSLK